MSIQELKDLKERKPEKFNDLIKSLAKQQCDSLWISGFNVPIGSMEQALLFAIDNLEI